MKKDGDLWAALPTEKKPQQLAQGVFSYIQAGPDRVVFMQQPLSYTVAKGTACCTGLTRTNWYWVN